MRPMRRPSGRIARLMDTARKMPPLTHKERGRPFQILESDVCAWLISIPGARQIVFDAVRNAGLIVYDEESNTWRGVEWE